MFSRPSRLSALAGLVLAASTLALAGCSGAPSDDGPPCASTTGTLTGTLRIGNEPRGGAIAILSQVGEIPLQVMANGEGVYSVELEAGSWSVTGEEGAYCTTTAPISTVVSACETTVVDLTLECVL